jgi:hypothetical protein
MRRTATLAFALVLAASGAEAVDQSAGASFLNNTLSVREAGMGNVSLGRPDLLTAWTNPATLADLETVGAIALHGGTIGGGLSVPFGLGFGIRPSEYFAFGGLFYADIYGFEQVDTNGVSLSGSKLYQLSYTGGLVLASQWGWGGLGLTVKRYDEVRSGSGSFSSEMVGGFAVDLGARLKFGPVGIATAFRNLGGLIAKSDTSYAGDVILPLEARLGASYEVKKWGLRAGVDVIGTDIGLDYVGWSPGVGLEYWPVSSFGIRAGNGGIGRQDNSYTFGCSLATKVVGLDLVYASTQIGYEARINLSFGIGKHWSNYNGAKGSGSDVAQMKTPAVKDAQGPSQTPLEPMATLKPGQVVNLAVAELKAEGTSASDAAVITGLIRNSLVKYNSISVVDKSNMDRVLAEQTFQQTGCTTQECAVKLGKLLNVRCMVVGSFGKLLSSYFLNVNLVDVENGRIISAESEKVSNIDEIERSVGNLSSRIATKATNWYAANQKKG